MALSENEVAGENAKSNATTESSKPTSNDRKEKPLTKIIVRRLPQSMTKDEFIEQVSPIADYDYLYLVKGDMSLGENAFCRVYINFVHAKDVFIFKEKFDNYVFVDGKGHEYPAVVEFAAFQKIPKRRSKFRVDPKCNTIETDPTYLEFLESLKDQPTEEEKPEFSYQPSSDVKKDLTTPLLEYIKQRKVDKQRIREEKREERKRREIERKKMREEDRRKRKTETFPAVTKPSKESFSKSIQSVEVKEKDEITTKPDKNDKMEYKSNEKSYKKYEDRKLSSKVKPKTNPRSEKVYDKKLEFKKKDEGKVNKYNDRESKKDLSESQKPAVKKVKKYSERREERKIEAQKAEQKKTVQQDSEKSTDAPAEVKQKTEKPKKQAEKQQETNAEQESKSEDDCANRIYNSEPSLFQEKLQRAENSSAVAPERRKSMDESKSDGLAKENESKLHRHMSLSEEMSAEECSNKPEGSSSNSSGSKRNKENDPRTQKRIRNKDRPTLQIYQPGMLSRKRQTDHPEEPKI